jgi:hypothetical protein
MSNVPTTVAERAEFALSYIVRLGRRSNPKSYILCEDAPQWAADVINAATNEHGVIDQRRQEFVIDSLRRLIDGRFAGETIGSPPSNREVKSWNVESGLRSRTRYVQFAEGTGTPAEELRLARRAERSEVNMQVLDHLMREFYDEKRVFNFRTFQKKEALRELDEE